MLHAAFVRSPHAHARIRGSTLSAARRHAGVVAVYTAHDLGDYWQPGTAAGAAAADRGHRLQPAHAGAARQGQGAPCRRAGRDGDRREPLPRRGRRAATSWSTTSRCRPSSTSSGALQPRRAARARRPAGSNVAAHVRQTQGRLRRRPRRRAAPRHPAPLPLRPRRVVADRDARRRGAVGRQGRPADRLGHHAGAGRHPQRPRGDARPDRSARCA